MGSRIPQPMTLHHGTDGDMMNPREHGPPPQQPSTFTTASEAGVDGNQPGNFLASLRSRYTAARPDPWLQMKFAVGILSALAIWSFYVVIGRVCTPMIQGRSSTGLKVAVGVTTMILYILLFLMFTWSYIKMVSTGPGFAIDRVPKSSPPQAADNEPLVTYPSSQRRSEEIPLTRNSSPRVALRPAHEDTTLDPSGPDPSTLAPVSNLLSTALHRVTSRQESSSTTLAALSTPIPEDRRSLNKAANNDTKIADWRVVQRPVPKIEIGPRWCRFCRINKPDRTHHCRHCGTCVLQFDHHCIWVGQCVGWGNHKFFMIFCFWGMLFCFYMMIFLIIVATKDTVVDGQVVGLIAVSALFGLFTFAMLTTHVHLILTGRSTVESFKGRDQMEQEDRILQLEYGYLWHNKEKRKVKRRWKEEWGGTSVDERWKWGTPGELWKEEMGAGWAGWIFPVGKPRGDGVHYRSNPRFGTNGEWLRKKDWPQNLRTE